MRATSTDFRWSFSQWENYDQCPARWKFQSVLKLPRGPSGPAAARGTSMHERVAGYIENQPGFTLEHLKFGDPDERFGDKPPAVIHPKYIPIIDAYREHPNGDRYVEKQLCFDADWAITAPKSALHAFTGVLDAVRFTGDYFRTAPSVLRIAEWKSGKPKDSHAEQRSIYALIGYHSWLANVVHVTTYYLESATEPPGKLKVEMGAGGFEDLRVKWNQRVTRMRGDKVCAPRPGYYCNWCDYAKRKGGPCQFGG